MILHMHCSTPPLLKPQIRRKNREERNGTKWKKEKIAGNLTGGTAPRAIVRRDSNHGTNSAALDLKFVVFFLAPRLNKT
jgi:hypothetical protein